jgi:hypothetical protein
MARHLSYSTVCSIYPNTHFNQSQKDAILNGPMASFLF